MNNLRMLLEAIGSTRNEIKNLLMMGYLESSPEVKEAMARLMNLYTVLGSNVETYLQQWDEVA